MVTLRTYGLAAAGASGAAAAFELIRVIVNGGAASGQNALSSFVQAITFSVVLGLAAFGLATHRQIGWIAGVFGAVYALGYGIVLRAAGNVIGILYMVLGLALIALMIKSLPYFRTVEPV